MPLQHAHELAAAAVLRGMIVRDASWGLAACAGCMLQIAEGHMQRIVDSPGCPAMRRFYPLPKGCDICVTQTPDIRRPHLRRNVLHGVGVVQHEGDGQEGAAQLI